VYLFRPSLSFLAEAQPRLETSEDKRHFLADVHINFFRRPHEPQSKRHHWKNYKLQITNDVLPLHLKDFSRFKEKGSFQTEINSLKIVKIFSKCGRKWDTL
jgi:hypothetical protein